MSLSKNCFRRHIAVFLQYVKIWLFMVVLNNLLQKIFKKKKASFFIISVKKHNICAALDISIVGIICTYNQIFCHYNFFYCIFFWSYQFVLFVFAIDKQVDHYSVKKLRICINLFLF